MYLIFVKQKLVLFTHTERLVSNYQGMRGPMKDLYTYNNC